MAAVSRKRKRLEYTDYTVAMICPLEVEMSAARYLLDEEHESLHHLPGDTNEYILGQMSGHNVAIAYLTEGRQGVGAAATVATHMMRTFPSIQLRLLVGIGGGVPNKQDVRLGDVVVGMPADTQGAVVQYDLGKNTTTGFSRKGYLLPPPQQWIHVVSNMRSKHRLTKQNKITGFLSEMLCRYPDLTEYRRPPPESDILYAQDNLHVIGEETCIKCDKTPCHT